MTLDLQLEKWLNLLRGSNKFVLKDEPDGGAEVLSPERVPALDGFYWVHGETTLNSGRKVESAFHIDTDSGGELYEVYWWIDGKWYDHQDPKAHLLLGSKEQIFPFDWRFSVPLTEDSHHTST